MNKNLAIFTAQLGTVSETFVRRHVEDLLPGKTVVVARRFAHPMGGRWQAPCPVLFLDVWASRFQMRLARRMGLREERLRVSAITRFLRRHKVDVVLGEYLDQFVDFVPMLDRLAIPYVVQGHGIDLSAALLRPGVKEKYAAYKSARAILTRCEFHRQRLISIGLPASRIHVNPGGVSIPLAMPQREPDATRRFLAIGRMVPKKGPIYLLEAFRLAAEKNRDISLDYIGDGELLPAARQFVDACGLSGRVRLHGAASEEVKHLLLTVCGVFVQHSITDPDTGDEEGLPAGIQEAMAYGMAVISTRHSGIAEAVVDGETGLLVDEGDVKAMAEAFLAVPAVARKLGDVGYRRAAANYGWEHERARLRYWLLDSSALPVAKEA